MSFAPKKMQRLPGSESMSKPLIEVEPSRLTLPNAFVSIGPGWYQDPAVT